MPNRETTNPEINSVEEDEKSLKFKCPVCGYNRLQTRHEVIIDVETVSRDGSYTLGCNDKQFEIDFNCRDCGILLEDEEGETIGGDDLVEWLPANCEQGQSNCGGTGETDCRNSPPKDET